MVLVRGVREQINGLRDRNLVAKSDPNGATTLDGRWDGAGAPEDASRKPHANELKYIALDLLVPSGGYFLTSGLNRPTIEQGQWFPLALSWFASDIDFRRFGVGLNDITAHQVAWPALHLADLALKSFVISGAGLFPRVGSIAYTIGAVEMYAGISQFLFNRID